jgi:hypothetical protein
VIVWISPKVETGMSNKRIKNVARIVFTKTSCDLSFSRSKTEPFECQQDSGHMISITGCNHVSFSGI